MSPVVKVDENYKHESLDWLYKLVIKKSKNGAYTAQYERAIRITDEVIEAIERQGAES